MLPLRQLEGELEGRRIEFRHRGTLDLGFERIEIVRTDSKDFIDFPYDGAGFAVGELTVGVLELLKCGAGSSAGLAVFLQLHRFAAGAGQSIDEPREGGAIAAEFLIEGTRPEVAKRFKNMQRAELQRGVIDLSGVEVPD